MTETRIIKAVTDTIYETEYVSRTILPSREELHRGTSPIIGLYDFDTSHPITAQVNVNKYFSDLKFDEMCVRAFYEK